MSRVDLVVADDPDPEDLATLEDRLADATAAVTGHPRSGERQLAVLARIDDGTLVGGISGWTWGGTCELLHLWVDDDARGDGLGTRLLDAAEAEAVERGCHQVVLFTHAVHAGHDGQRYPRRGYELVGRVDDYPAGDAALWYRKPLGPAGSGAATEPPSLRHVKETLLKLATGFHKLVFNASHGRIAGRGSGMPVLMLTTTGRKSGQPRTTMLTSPLQDGGRIMLVASNGGDNRDPAWLHNLRADPQVQVTMEGRTVPMTAHVADATEKAELWPRIVADHANYAGYQAKTERDIPVVVLEP